MGEIGAEDEYEYQNTDGDMRLKNKVLETHRLKDSSTLGTWKEAYTDS